MFLFETIRIESGQIRHLAYHQERVSRSVPGIPLNLEETFGEYFSTQPLPPTGIHKLRITYTPAGHVEKICVSVYSRRIIKTLRLIQSDTLSYPVKSEDRSCIEALYAQKGECDDILIIQNGFVTDTSFANIIFLQGGEWITPDTPLLPGTCRARLLALGKIRECRITPHDLQTCSRFQLINALLEPDFTPSTHIGKLLISR